MYPMSPKQAAFFRDLQARYPQDAQIALAQYGHTSAALKDLLKRQPLGNFRPGTQMYAVASELLTIVGGPSYVSAMNESTVRTLVRKLSDGGQIGRGQFCFKQNTGGSGRVPLPTGSYGDLSPEPTQYGRLRKYAFDAIAQMQGKKKRKGERPQGEPSQPVPAPEPTPEPSQPEPEQNEPTPEPEPEPVPEPMPEPQPATGIRATVERFRRELSRLRQICKDRGHDKLESGRPDLDGTRAIIEGTPVEFLLHSVTAAWGEDTRAQAGVEDFCPIQWVEQNCPGERVEGIHAAFPLVKRLMAANVPVYLYGDAGTFKSSMAKRGAAELGLAYFEVNLSGAMPSAVKGKDRLNSFIVSSFCEAYEQPAVICIEEMDAAPPAVLTAINNAIAGDEFHNDADGKVYKRHPEFRIVATANTVGTGGTKQFNARGKLDDATRDRFRTGMVPVRRDDRLVDAIVDGILTAAGY